MKNLRSGLIIILLFCSACSLNEAEQEVKQQELVVSAASSLTLVLDELDNAFEQENPDIHLVINYGGSGTLVNQLKQGAPGDMLLLASQDWMDRAIEADVVEREEEFPLLENRLVLAGAPHTDIRQLEDLLDSTISKVAIGDPSSVPVGAYAQQALQAKGIWEEIRGKAVFAKNARQAAMYIASGDVGAGIVFESDLKAFPKLKLLQVISQELHEPIIYPAAITKQTSNKEAAERFFAFLKTDEAATVFEQYGFRLVK